MGSLPYCVSWVSAWRNTWPASCGWVYIVYSFYLWLHIRQKVTSLDTQESCIFDQLEIQPSLILPRYMLYSTIHIHLNEFTKRLFDTKETLHRVPCFYSLATRTTACKPMQIKFGNFRDIIWLWSMPRGQCWFHPSLYWITWFIW